MSLVINAFAVIWGIAGMTVSNQRLIRETESRPITSIVRQRYLRLYGHVARYPVALPAYRVISEEITQSGEVQRVAYKVGGWDKSMFPAWS